MAPLCDNHNLNGQSKYCDIAAVDGCMHGCTQWCEGETCPPRALPSLPVYQRSERVIYYHFKECFDRSHFLKKEWVEIKINVLSGMQNKHIVEHGAVL